MKQITLLLFTLSLVLALQGQESKSVTITPGGLRDAIFPAERSTITSLTVSGTMDACDFRTMRDALPALAYVYLEDANIVAYTGKDGTYAYPVDGIYFNSINVNYPANEIPAYAFQRKSTLLWITFPASTRSVGPVAFVSCTALTSVTVPPLVTDIGENAFQDCSGLTSVMLPPNLKRIRSKTFYHCSALTSVDIPTSVTSIEFAAFIGCRGLQSVTIPSSVTSLGDASFAYCTSLTSITIPSSVANIGIGAFYGSDALTTVYANASVPVDLSQRNGVFPLYYNHFCKLIVPYGSRARYMTSQLWKEFNKIEEAASGIAIDVNYLEYDAATYGHTTGIVANVDWTVSSDQPWLTVDTPTGKGNGHLTLTIEANPTIYRRRGKSPFPQLLKVPHRLLPSCRKGQKKPSPSPPEV